MLTRSHRGRRYKRKPISEPEAGWTPGGRQAEDFAEVPPPKNFRLFNTVRLRYAGTACSALANPTRRAAGPCSTMGSL